MQEIFDISEAFEPIEKNHCMKYPFPAVTILNESIYFNSRASAIVPKLIKWIVTTNYIVGLPTDENDLNGYKIYNASNSERLRRCSFPASMRNDKKVRPGYYRLYKYKDGFCMKRNEQIKEET